MNNNRPPSAMGVCLLSVFPHIASRHACRTSHIILVMWLTSHSVAKIDLSPVPAAHFHEEAAWSHKRPDLVPSGPEQDPVSHLFDRYENHCRLRHSNGPRTYLHFQSFYYLI